MHWPTIPLSAQAQQLNEDQIQELRDIVAWRLMGQRRHRRAGEMAR